MVDHGKGLELQEANARLRDRLSRMVYQYTHTHMQINYANALTVHVRKPPTQTRVNCENHSKLK